MAADLVVLGPGSWFTSVIPHVLVPELAAALQATSARRALVLNLVAEPGETAGFSVERHLHVLAQHAPGFTVHDIIIDADRVPSEREREQLRRTATLLHAEVHFADVSRPGTPLHDPGKLAAALTGPGGPQGSGSGSGHGHRGYSGRRCKTTTRWGWARRQRTKG